MFDDATDDDLIQFEDSWRQSWPEHHYRASEPFVDAALKSFHPRGFTREKAVEHLAAYRDGRELPFLLLRLNDWVPQVRDAARKAVVARLTPAFADQFVKHLRLVIRLQYSRRAVHAEVLSEVARLLAKHSSRGALILAMNDQRGAMRRAAAGILFDGNPDDVELARAALRVADPIVRMMAMRRLPVAENQDVFERLLDDPAGSVRAQAVMMAAEKPRLVSALLDRHGSVRAAARFRLRDEGIDFAALYRDALNTDRPAVAVSALGETGSRRDAELLLPFLRHQQAAIRRAAVRSVMTLGQEDHLDTVMESLHDESRGVSSQARKALSKYGAIIGAAKLWSMYEDASVDHARMNLLLLMPTLSKWDAITLYIRAMRDRDEMRAALARELVVRWNRQFNRNSSPPGARQLAALRTELSESSLDEETRSLILFSMQPFV